MTRLLDREHVGELIEQYFDVTAGAAVQEPLVRCAQRLHRDGVSGDRAACALFVPGRVEVLGKHTDYAGGRSLLATLDRGICLIAVPREDPTVTIVDVVSGEALSFPLSSELQPAHGWANYPMTVARRVARNFNGPLTGGDIAFSSSLPAAAGMSSSSALMVATFLAFSAINELDATEAYRQNLGRREELADYLAAVESGADHRTLLGDDGVGTKGGSQDHTAILCARPGELVQYAFGPVRFERAVPMPAGHSLVVAVSGVVAAKTGAARDRYNRASGQMQLALSIWRRETGRNDASIGAALATHAGAPDRLIGMLRHTSLPKNDAETLIARVEQFIEESTVIVPAAGDALARGDLAEFGRLVDRSQRLAETALRNQVAETEFLARSARELGAVAASAFGAGFGGSVYALVEDASSDDFLARWHAAYRVGFPPHSAASTFFSSRAGEPAVRLV